ncbi:unnamed protein product [Rhizoctonia solani]|uniref:ARID domain-containing protein n=1 Tax=Rhizoctonia solani TaxID=456999 RepID=A0A8H3HCS6_9AGAM|nr:unnamed protein product [Rhizoctonia solani]
MGSSSSKSRVTKRGNASTRGSTSHGASGASVGTGSSGRRRVAADQMQTTRLDFPEIVTFNPIYSHMECYLRQLNWWILDGKLRSAPFRLNKGGPAGPAGECGSVGQWNYCAMNEKYKQPPASRYIGAAAPGFNLEAGLSQTIQTTIQICHQQPLEDANVRTALLYLVERLAYQGIAIRTDLDLFSIYAHLKSMSTIGYAPPPEDVVGTRVMNILALAALKAPVEWENRMEIANRIKVELHADILEVHLYYQELQQLSGNKLRTRLERDKAKYYILYSPVSQNAADTSLHRNEPAGMEELRRKISYAREEAQAIGRGNPSLWDELDLETAASLLARAEGVLAPHPSASTATGLSSMPCSSTITCASNYGHTSTSGATQAPSLSSSAAPANPTSVGVAALAGLPGAVTLNSYSEPAIPSDRLTFSYLWKLWALQNGKTQQDIPTLRGKFLDIQLLALKIDSLGGQAKMRRNNRLWKRLATQLKLVDSEAQDDEHSKSIVDLLQRTQEELLLPFEQYCVAWSRLSEEEKNKSLVEYATATKGVKANLPSPTPIAGDALLPALAAQDRRSALTLAPNSSELYEGTKLVDVYFYGFYPGVRLHTKIERLLDFPPSELPKYTWTRKRLSWLSKFSQNYAGMSTDDIIAYMALHLPKRLAEQSPGKELIPPSGWPTNPVKVTEVLPPTSGAMFSPSLIVQANQFVERTLQAIEAVRPLRRVDLPDAHRQPLKALVTEAYDLALFFYRTVALHYMLFLDEKDTRSAMIQAVLIIEQFFLSSTGYPAHIMNLEYAITSATRMRDVVHSTREAYTKRYQDYLRLKAEESRSGSFKP